MKPVKSSNISHIGYANGVLTIRFMSGTVYDYHGVTPAQHRALMEADSHGAHFSQHIKHQFVGKKRDK